MKIRRGTSIKQKLNILVYGATGSGKSTQALQLAKFKRPDGTPYRVWVFDIESGGVDEVLDTLMDEGVDTENIFVAYTQSLKEVELYISKIANKETLYMLDEEGEETDEEILDAYGEPFVPDCVIVDGTSILKLTCQEGLVQLSQKRNKIKKKNDGGTAEEVYVATQNAGMELKDWNALNRAGQNLVLSLMALPQHVILTAREKDETTSVRDSSGQIASVATGAKIYDSFKGIDYNVKTILRMFRDEEDQVCMEVLKDRTGTFKVGDIIEDPSFLDFESTINKNSKRPEFALKNTLKDSVLKDSEIFEKEVLGTDASIVDEVNDNMDGKETAQGLIKEIKETLRALSSNDKTVKRNAIKAAGLPDAYTKITDTEILKQILDIVSA